ncbi:hypothetical protein GCM10022234_00670 [Aeromicrobium panaciterrae]
MSDFFDAWVPFFTLLTISGLFAWVTSSLWMPFVTSVLGGDDE